MPNPDFQQGEALEPQQRPSRVRELSVPSWRAKLLAAIGAVAVMTPAILHAEEDAPEPALQAVPLAVPVSKKTSAPKAIEKLDATNAFQIYLQNMASGERQPFTKFPLNPKLYVLVIVCHPRLEKEFCTAGTTDGQIMMEAPEIIETPVETPDGRMVIRKENALVIDLVSAMDKTFDIGTVPLNRKLEVGHFQSEATIAPALQTLAPAPTDSGFVEEFTPAAPAEVPAEAPAETPKKVATEKPKGEKKKPFADIDKAKFRTAVDKALAKADSRVEKNTTLDSAHDSAASRYYLGFVGQGPQLVSDMEGAVGGGVRGGVTMPSGDNDFGFDAGVSYSQGQKDLPSGSVIPLRGGVPIDRGGLAVDFDYGRTFYRNGGLSLAFQGSTGVGAFWNRIRGATGAAVSREDKKQVLDLPETTGPNPLVMVNIRAGIRVQALQRLRVVLGLEAATGFQNVQKEAGAGPTEQPLTVGPYLEVGGMFP